MLKNRDSLATILNERLGQAPPCAKQAVDQASEIIVFGSMSTGLEREDSDMDVLCVSSFDYKLKSKPLDLIVVSRGAMESSVWLQTELANHIAKYGTWIKGSSQWRDKVHIGPKTVWEKRRRVSAFMRSLQESWFRLEECFRLKYSTKVRRETQRLMLLERNIPVPPTRVLDQQCADLFESTTAVLNRLKQMSPTVGSLFVDDLIGRAAAHFSSIKASSS
jgi:Nucleotidyltransferase domain